MRTTHDLPDAQDLPDAPATTDPREDIRISFLGGGNMARALIGCLLRTGSRPADLTVGEPLPAARTALAQDFAVATRADNVAAVTGAQVAILAVKPQDCASVLATVAPVLQRQGTLLLSIAAGVRVANLRQLCPGVPVVRVMPNRAVQLGAGASGAYAPDEVTAAGRALVQRVFGAAGRLVWLRREADIDLVTALSGSGPAYFFLLAEQLAAAATALGLERSTALLLAAETLYGAGQLIHSVGTDVAPAEALAQQRIAVTSPGGTTEAALRVLADSDFSATVARAIQAAATRSVELAALLDR